MISNRFWIWGLVVWNQSGRNDSSWTTYSILEADSYMYESQTLEIRINSFGRHWYFSTNYDCHIGASYCFLWSICDRSNLSILFFKNIRTTPVATKLPFFDDDSNIGYALNLLQQAVFASYSMIGSFSMEGEQCNYDDFGSDSCRFNRTRKWSYDQRYEYHN